MIKGVTPKPIVVTPKPIVVTPKPIVVNRQKHTLT